MKVTNVESLMTGGQIGTEPPEILAYISQIYKLKTTHTTTSEIEIPGDRFGVSLQAGSQPTALLIDAWTR